MTVPELTELAVSGGRQSEENARTVASHLANIRAKRNVRTRVEVALWVTRTGISATGAERTVSRA
jgi:DNA-binding CsgD family transcriptional regulator